MKNIYKRFVAYIIDMVLVLLVVNTLSSISFINPNLNKYNKYYNEYQKMYVNYQKFINDINKYYKDKKINDIEYNKILKKYPNKIKYIDKYYNDNKITKKEYNNIINKTTKDFQNKYKKIYYYMNKYSIVYNIIYIACLLLYFVLFNIITDGETLGKKIMKLKITSIDDTKVSILKYLIRAIILYNPLFYLSMIIGTLLLNINSFYNYALIMSNVKNYLFIIVIATAIIKNDNRGLHEMLSKTKVVKSKDYNYKKKGNDIEVIKDKNNHKRKSKNKKIVIDEEN